MGEYDVIIIGAGSVGVPIALAAANDGLKTLVIDSLPSVAQGDNKHAIGGIRATHSHEGKVLICKRSIEIFSTWEKRFGDDIWWEQGGYTFLAFTEQDELLLRDTVKIQRSNGLNIDYVSAEKIKELIPGINEKGLLGGTYSPEDGNASPLLALHAFYRQSQNLGTEYLFNEKVMNILTKKHKVVGVKTTQRKYKTRFVVNAAGAHAKKIASMVGLNVPVEPESHEAGITEPVKKFFSPMVIDIRPCIDAQFGNSKNYYFYQNKHGKILFCLTPEPSISGINRQETSSFLPQVSKRIVNLLPKLRNIKIRRTWRGVYPMTPDGNPIIGSIDEIEGYIHAIGMCGQGFMLGPGIGEILSHFMTNKTTSKEREILGDLSYNRNFFKKENLK
jgi:sarcosine oxidase subunit beta